MSKPISMSQPVITDSNAFDWSTAHKAAKEILNQCESSFYTPPEALDVHAMRIAKICQAMNALVDALKIRPPGAR